MKKNYVNRYIEFSPPFLNSRFPISHVPNPEKAIIRLATPGGYALEFFSSLT